MNFTNQAHLEMLMALLEHRIEFLVVGGYAVIFHGYVRTTADLDLWVRPTAENKMRLLEVLTRLQFDPEGIETLRSFNFNDVVVFHIGEEPDRIDFLSHVQGLNFENAYKQRSLIAFNSYQIPFLHLDDLIVSKLLADRLQDRADVAKLNEIKKRQ